MKNIVFPVLKKFRSELHLRQKEVVAELKKWGVTMNESDLSKVENGKRKVYDNELFAFTKVYNCSFEDLFEGYLT